MEFHSPRLRNDFWAGSRLQKGVLCCTPCAAHKSCAQRHCIARAMKPPGKPEKEPKMEQGVNKVVSFGIGALESARASAETLLKNLETEINALIANGESVQSENAVKVRSAVTDASKRVSTILDQAKAQYSDLSAKAQKALADLQAKASELAAKLPINKGQAA